MLFYVTASENRMTSTNSIKILHFRHCWCGTRVTQNERKQSEMLSHSRSHVLIQHDRFARHEGATLILIRKTCATWWLDFHYQILSNFFMRVLRNWRGHHQNAILFIAPGVTNIWYVHVELLSLSIALLSRHLRSRDDNKCPLLCHIALITLQGMEFKRSFFG